MILMARLQVCVRENYVGFLGAYIYTINSNSAKFYLLVEHTDDNPVPRICPLSSQFIWEERAGGEEGKIS